MNDEKTREQMLRTMPEEDIERSVRSTLERARDWYALRGRKILSVDLQTHLDFFNEAVMYDRLDEAKLTVGKSVN